MLRVSVHELYIHKDINHIKDRIVSLVLIRVRHPINPRPSTPKELIPILLRPPRIRHVSPLNHSGPGRNPISPLLQRRELIQINLQPRRTPHPRVIRDVGDRILRTG